MRVPQPQPSGPVPVFARARTEKVLLHERFTFKQEISMQPSQERDGEPAGLIKIAVPLDGDQYFTREAIGDVQRAGWRPGPPSSALIGHLLLSGFEQTDLGSGAGLNGSFGSIPIKVPLPDGADGSGLADLSADRKTCVIEHRYRPDSDSVALNVFAELLDPDGVDLLGEERAGAEMRRLLGGSPTAEEVAGQVKKLVERAAKGADRDAQLVVDDVARQITQQVSFRSYLQLRITVQLILPASVREADPKPEISLVSLRWPTLTSMRSLRLEGDDGDSNIKYNPNTRAIEWTGARLQAHKDDGNKDTPRTYQSDTMVLRIDQPGELYAASDLSGTVKVRVPGVLLSGMKARLFDGTGTLRDARTITSVSTVSSTFKLILDDAFAGRVLTPFQHLYFDEVIPDPMRIADVRTALESRGFVVLNQQLAAEGPASPALRHFLIATRSEGPDLMELWIYLEGRHQDTERQQQRGGARFTTKLNSGELKMFVRGSLPGDSRELVKEMNDLQRALRDRFARLRQIR
jgi:hypothetical protein